MDSLLAVIAADQSLARFDPTAGPLDVTADGAVVGDVLYGNTGSDIMDGGTGNGTPRRMVFRLPEKPLSRMLVSVKTAAYRLVA